MNNRVFISFQKKYLRVIFFTLALCILFFTKIIFAEQYQLKLIVDLSEFKNVDTDTIWLDPLANPSNDAEYFVAQNNGIIYLTGKDGEIAQKAILNLPLKINTPAFISLTAMTLHPNFTQSKQLGYATLYTAHTIEFGQNNNNNRLTLNNTNIDFSFETVITAWQYDFDKLKIDPRSQREVLRIPIKNHNNAIQQLTFDPYQESWNDDYGQLYFSLNYENELKHHPLYSGVILRIYPMIFGDRNFTVSEANPFLKDPNINNEIVVLNGQNIERFFWAKNNHSSIFIQHNNIEQHRLSKAKVGDDLLTQPQSNLLWQQPSAMSSMLLYQGRSFLSLRNKMVFFTLLDNQWHLTSLPLTSFNNESPTFDKLISKQAISPTSHLSIHQDNQAEIILFDNHSNSLYSLHSTNSKVIEKSAAQSNTPWAGLISDVLYISLLAGLFLIIIFVYRKKKGKKGSNDFLDKDLVRFEYQPTTQTILLFRTNQKKAHKTLSLFDIVDCKVLLNNNVINNIDDQPKNAISNQKEVDIRDIFIKENSNKILKKQSRRIEIMLSDKDDSYTVHLYFRTGRNRLTGSKYYQAIDILIDLCWVISKCINPETTETRIIPVIARFATSVKPMVVSQPKKDDNIVDTNQSVKSIDTGKKSETIQVHDSSNGKTAMMQATHQTKAVDALQKLASLHQKGHLTNEEFTLAKTKLLQNILDS